MVLLAGSLAQGKINYIFDPGLNPFCWIFPTMHLCNKPRHSFNASLQEDPPAWSGTLGLVWLVYSRMIQCCTELGNEVYSLRMSSDAEKVLTEHRHGSLRRAFHKHLRQLQRDSLFHWAI